MKSIDQVIDHYENLKAYNETMGFKDEWLDSMLYHLRMLKEGRREHEDESFETFGY